MRNNLERPETIQNHLKPSRNYLKQARKQLTSRETSQEKADILWNESYDINFLQEFGTYMVEHGLQNKEIQL